MEKSDLILFLSDKRRQELMPYIRIDGEFIYFLDKFNQGFRFKKDEIIEAAKNIEIMK